MVLNRQTFKYQGKKLIEKVRFKPPLKLEQLFEEEGCFLYFKGEGAHLLSSNDKREMNTHEAVLIRCGRYFVDYIEKVEQDYIEVIAIHLYPDVLKKLYITELPALIEKRNYNKKSQILAPSDIISRFIDSLEFYFENPVLVNSDILELKIKELILLLIQSKNVDSILELITDLYSAKTVTLKKVIELHLYSNLSIEELARLSNLSLTSFKREFKKEFNDSPANYINAKKLQKARELLSITDMSISEIAYETGFNDPLYFSRIFKKKTGISPSSFRENSSPGQ